MVQIVILDKDLSNLESLLTVLNEKKYILNCSIQKEVRYEPDVSSETGLLKTDVYRLTGITRAILTDEVFKCLKTNGQSDDLSFFTLPVIDMDWSQAEKVKGYFDSVKLAS